MGRQRRKKRPGLRKPGQQDATAAIFSNSSPRFWREFSPKTKKPRETLGGFRLRPFSRRARAAAPREGGLAYGCFKPITVAAAPPGVPPPPPFPAPQWKFSINCRWGGATKGVCSGGGVHSLCGGLLSSF